MTFEAIGRKLYTHYEKVSKMSEDQATQRQKALVNILTTVSAALIFAVIIGSVTTFWTARINEQSIMEMKERAKQYVTKDELKNLKEFISVQFEDLKKDRQNDHK